jgi:hypothetical protein
MHDFARTGFSLFPPLPSVKRFEFLTGFTGFTGWIYVDLVDPVKELAVRFGPGKVSHRGHRGHREDCPRRVSPPLLNMAAARRRIDPGTCSGRWRLKEPAGALGDSVPGGVYDQPGETLIGGSEEHWQSQWHAGLASSDHRKHPDEILDVSAVEYATFFPLAAAQQYRWPAKPRPPQDKRLELSANRVGA